ncbi:hypothetical protein [Hydrogenophaga laconesensis]|jgi:hypothetical protein|uniref:Uncharacterized protein n=1 Tax=Hydrogenophaga laconesensis TaxID=1805971 RepID=A0ABU1V914_9BURK|nr:hypothetical protein [Hydrogenophaga laconesensis]MDR7093940.1 hypothetical protein [Hydrogenophaga laconesensis]NIQ81853.1 hypothetical protein [Anaerolineae bacterium]
MNELSRIADQYFNAFEGRRFYPKFFSLYWLAWLLTFVLWMWASTRFLDPVLGESDQTMLLVLVCEAMFFVAYAVIDKKKRLALRAAHGLPEEAPGAAVDEAKRSYLRNAFGREASEFSAIAQEAQTVRASTDALRPVGDGSLESILRRVHDPDRRSRLMSVVLAALAILVSLVVVGLGPDAPNVIEVLMSKGFQEGFTFLMVLTVVLFGMWHAVKLIWFNVLELLASWGARIGGESSFKSKKINYLLRDLVRLHAWSCDSGRRDFGVKTAIQRDSRSRRWALRRHVRVGPKRP